MRKPKFEVVIDCADPKNLAEFWREALGYTELWAADDLVVLVPEGDLDSPVLLQRVPEPKKGKNRVHIDLVAEHVEDEVRRLEVIGASRAHPGIQTYGPTSWVVMADPAGNEFCVSTGVPR